MRNRSHYRRKLVPFDWDFTALSDEEVLPACYYEYARESKTIVEGLKVGGRAIRITPLLPSRHLHNPIHNPLHKSIREHAAFLWLVLEAVDIRGPWQALSKSKRKVICERVTEYGSNANSPALLAFHRICPIHAELGVDSEIGVERLGVEIDWGSFQNDEIAETFKFWLKANRPPAFPGFVKRGKKRVEWWAKIERLGLLRLRSRYTFAEAKPFLAQLTVIAKNTDSGECNREAKIAVTDFHNLFPFLDLTEMPRSWPIR